MQCSNSITNTSTKPWWVTLVLEKSQSSSRAAIWRDVPQGPFYLGKLLQSLSPKFNSHNYTETSEKYRFMAAENLISKPSSPRAHLMFMNSLDPLHQWDQQHGKNRDLAFTTLLCTVFKMCAPWVPNYHIRRRFISTLAFLQLHIAQGYIFPCPLLWNKQTFYTSLHHRIIWED